MLSHNNFYITQNFLFVTKQVEHKHALLALPLRMFLPALPQSTLDLLALLFLFLFVSIYLSIYLSLYYICISATTASISLDLDFIRFSFLLLLSLFLYSLCVVSYDSLNSCATSSAAELSHFAQPAMTRINSRLQLAYYLSYYLSSHSVSFYLHAYYYTLSY